MGLFEVIFADTIEADDFFDAVDQAKARGLEVISVAQMPLDEEDVYD